MAVDGLLMFERGVLGLVTDLFVLVFLDILEKQNRTIALKFCHKVTFRVPARGVAASKGGGASWQMSRWSTKDQVLRMVIEQEEDQVVSEFKNTEH